MFIYFDLGNVIALFDRQRAFRQIGEVAGLSPEQAAAAQLSDRLSMRHFSHTGDSQSVWT